MTNSELLRLIEILAWPLIAAIAILLFRRPISNAFRSGSLKVKLFGTEIETTGQELMDVIWRNLNYFNPSNAQWDLLVQLATTREGLSKADVEKTLDYKSDLRPLRNAGLMTGDGSSLAKSNTLFISPLGEFIVLNAKKRPNKRMEATPIDANSEDDANSSVSHP